MPYLYSNVAGNRSHTYLLPVVADLLKNIPAGSKVLDLGCGNGAFLVRFSNRNWRLFGSDLSEEGISQAKSRQDGIQYFTADTKHDTHEIYLEQCAGPVDVILSTEVIEHVFEPRSFARLCYRLLRPGGILVISTPYHGYAKNLALALTGAMDSHFTALWDDGHIKFWSRKTLGVLLEEAGFRNLQFRGAGRIPYLWKSMVMAAEKPA